MPRRREAHEALPGVGRKTANVVLNTAFGEPTIAVDTHIFRVSNRTGIAPGKTPRKVEDALLRSVPDDFKRGAHHWLILHGRYVCTRAGRAAGRARSRTCASSRTRTSPERVREFTDNALEAHPVASSAGRVWSQLDPSSLSYGLLDVGLRRRNHSAGQVLVVREVLQLGKVRRAVVAKYQTIRSVLAMVPVVEGNQTIVLDDDRFADSSMWPCSKRSLRRKLMRSDVSTSST